MSLTANQDEVIVYKTWILCIWRHRCKNLSLQLKAFDTLNIGGRMCEMPATQPTPIHWHYPNRAPHYHWTTTKARYYLGQYFILISTHFNGGIDDLDGAWEHAKDSVLLCYIAVPTLVMRWQVHHCTPFVQWQNGAHGLAVQWLVEEACALEHVNMKGVKHINAALHTLMHHILNKMMYVMERGEKDVTFL